MAFRPFQLKAAALVFLASFALPIATSESAWASLYRSAYLPIGVLAFFAAQYAFSDALSFRRLSQALMLVLFLIGIDGVFQIATGESLVGRWPTYSNTTRIRAGLPHPNDLSMVAVLLPLALVPLQRGVSKRALAAIGAALPLQSLFVVLNMLHGAQQKNRREKAEIGR